MDFLQRTLKGMDCEVYINSGWYHDAFVPLHISKEMKAFFIFEKRGELIDPIN